MSAVSNRLTPASTHTSTILLASSRLVSPTALKNSVVPPKVAAPKLSAETFSPEFPSVLYSTPDWMKGPLQKVSASFQAFPFRWRRLKVAPRRPLPLLCSVKHPEKFEALVARVAQCHW